MTLSRSRQLSRISPWLGLRFYFWRVIGASLVVISTYSLNNPAAAQSPGSSFPGVGGMGRAHRDQGDKNRDCAPTPESAPSSERLREELEATKARLNLSSTQYQLWDSFEDRSRKVLEDSARQSKPLSISVSSPAPQQIERVLDVPRDRITALEDVSDSAKNLYLALSEDQRRIADIHLPSIIRILAIEVPMAGRMAQVSK